MLICCVKIKLNCKITHRKPKGCLKIENRNKLLPTEKTDY